MRKKLLSASLGIIIVVLLLVGCGSSDSSGGTMASGSWTPGQTSIKLLGASWYTPIARQRLEELLKER